MRKRTRVLLVDDDPLILRASVRALEEGGFELFQATSGAEGLALVKEKRPDLLLLDVVLPDMDGFEVCRQIKADPALSDTFVVFVSNYRTAPDDQADGLESGADGYIARPIANRELVARVHAMARIQRAQAETRARAQQQEAVAWLGQQALRTALPEDLLKEA
ncbi:MAG: response regulator, partial [Armatimonadota bacterium]|nr:response regulator [Armatimonadota bacterium]